MRKLWVCALAVLSACSETKSPSEPGEETQDSLSEAARPAYEMASAFWSAKDEASAADAFNKFASRVEALYSKHTRQTASRLATEAAIAAQSKATPNEVQYVSGVMSGKFFDGTGLITPSTKPLSESERRCPTVYFVPGIFNSVLQQVVGRAETERVVRERDTPCELDVVGFINASTQGLDFQDQCIVRAIQISNPVVLEECGSAGDLIQAIRQMTWPGVEDEVLPLGMRLAEECARGRPTIPLGHSQGALFVAQALEMQDQFEPCMLPIALGSPIGKSGFGRWAQVVEGIVIAGIITHDILLALGQNDFEQVSTSLSRAIDSEAGDANLIEKLYLNTILHGLVESYLGAPESRARIGDIVETHARRLYDASCSHLPTSNVVYAAGKKRAGDPWEIWAVSLDPEGSDVPIGPAVDGVRNAQLIGFSLSPDGTLWGTSSTALYKINRTTGALTFVSTYPAEASPAQGIAVDGKGNVYVAKTIEHGYRNSRIVGLRIATMEVFMTSSDIFESVTAMAFAPDGTFFLILQNIIRTQYWFTFDVDTGEFRNLLGSGTWDFAEFNAGDVCEMYFIGAVPHAVARAYGSGPQVLTIDRSTSDGSMIRELDFYPCYW